MTGPGSVVCPQMPGEMVEIRVGARLQGWRLSWEERELEAVAVGAGGTGDGAGSAGTPLGNPKAPGGSQLLTWLTWVAGDELALRTDPCA